MKKPIKAAAKEMSKDGKGMPEAKGMPDGKGKPDAKGIPDAQMSKMGKKTDAKKPVAVKK